MFKTKAPAVPDTSSMVGNMLGLGPLMSQMQDPAFLAQVKAIIDAIAETRARVERIENLLAFLVSKVSSDDERTIAATLGRAELGTLGAGTCAATGGAADDGTGNAPPSPGSDRTRPGQARDGAASGAV
jgi:hypothetical protein